MIRQNAPTEKREMLEGAGVQQGACRGGVGAIPYYAQVPMTRAITTMSSFLAAMALRGGHGKIRGPACNMHEIGAEENAIEI